MIEIHMPKAESIGDEVIPETTIYIDAAIPNRKTLEEMEVYYQEQARTFVNAIKGSMPHGLIWHILLEIMRQHLCLFKVKMQ